MRRCLGVGFLLLLTSCGQTEMNFLGLRPDEFVVRARSEFQVTVDTDRSNASVTQPASAALPAATTFTLDNSGFAAPTPMSNGVMNFGTLQVSGLFDNSLRVCGTGGNQKCGNALIRIFTTGVAGAGLFNAVDNFGAPLTATLTTTPLTVGLLVANAAVMQTLSIPANKSVVRLSDFSPAPVYTFRSDFTNAGAGSYTTNIVVEYALTL